MLAGLVLDCRNTHGEGVHWDPRTERLWWTDIIGQAIWSHDPGDNAVQRQAVDGQVCAFAPHVQGEFIVAFADRVALVDGAWADERLVVAFEPGNLGSHLNDGRTDRQGRFVVGGMNEATGDADSSVIRVGADLSVETLITGVACANSICFDPDGRTMYFADTPEGTIRAYPYDPGTGALGAHRIHADLRDEPVLPDGSCVDEEGGVWTAEWEGARVVRVAPDGRIDRVIEMPVSKPTCCAFGRADLDTLFITTSRLNSDAARLEAEPLSGGLFACRPGKRGIPDAAFAG